MMVLCTRYDGFSLKALAYDCLGSDGVGALVIRQ